VSRNGGETRPADRRNLCKQRTNRAEDSICGLLGPNAVWQIVFYAGEPARRRSRRAEWPAHRHPDGNGVRVAEGAEVSPRSHERQFAEKIPLSR
jgi:hypothetical protein